MQDINASVSRLMIYRNLKDDPLIHRLLSVQYAKAAYLACREQHADTKSSEINLLTLYSEFYYALSEDQNAFSPDWGEYVLNLCRKDDNLFARRCALRKDSPASASAHRIEDDFEHAVKEELSCILNIANTSPDAYLSCISDYVACPGWNNRDTTSMDADQLYQYLFEFHTTNSFGPFAMHHFFKYLDGEWAPVFHPDPILPEMLFEYEYELSLVRDNTLRLIHQRLGENMLLFGARGTGKSSSIKAMVNAYHVEGLRLIEVDKDGIAHLPALLEKLSGLAPYDLSFIIFLDDLVLQENDSQFRILKTVLEGGVNTRPPHVAIYATSNRRHMIAEKHDNDMYENDAREEKLSLSDRFGVTIRFASPNQKTFLSIVYGILDKHALQYNPEEIAEKALAWAMRENGRSPRTARQFVDYYRSLSPNA